MSDSNPLGILGVLLGFLAFLPSADANIQINTPNGGEVYTVGDAITIQWVVVAPFPVVDWDIFYSTTSATGPWSTVIANLPPVGSVFAGTVHSYLWTIPNAAEGDTVWVRVIQDNTGLDFEDVSNGSFTIEGDGGIEFRRGDSNGDGGVNIADAIYLLGNLFPNGAPNALECLDAADTNADGAVNIADAIALLDSLFGTPPLQIPAPFPNCGSAENLGCDLYVGCP